MHTVAFLALTAVTLACEPSVSDTPVSDTTTTAASPELISNERAIARVTQARCARQLSCGFIGTGRFFEDYDACSKNMQSTTRDYLIGQRCAEGFDEWALSTCTSEIRNDSCDDPHGAIDYIPSCSSVRLCR